MTESPPSPGMTTLLRARRGHLRERGPCPATRHRSMALPRNAWSTHEGRRRCPGSARCRSGWWRGRCRSWRRRRLMVFAASSLGSSSASLARKAKMTLSRPPTSARSGGGRRGGRAGPGRCGPLARRGVDKLVGDGVRGGAHLYDDDAVELCPVDDEALGEDLLSLTPFLVREIGLDAPHAASFGVIVAIDGGHRFGRAGLART